MLRRPIVIIGIVLLLILSGVIIFNIDWGGSSKPQENQEAKQNKLVDYAFTDVKVRMTTKGEINSNEDHRQIQITVDHDNVSAAIMAGYQGNTIKSDRFSNNPSSYSAFLSALETLGFTKTQTEISGANEEGSCPTGQRISFDIYDSNETILHSWTTSCTRKLGTFAGDYTGTQKLFQAQVPNYNDFVSGVSL